MEKDLIGSSILSLLLERGDLMPLINKPPPPPPPTPPQKKKRKEDSENWATTRTYGGKLEEH